MGLFLGFSLFFVTHFASSSPLLFFYVLPSLSSHPPLCPSFPGITGCLRPSGIKSNLLVSQVENQGLESLIPALLGLLEGAWQDLSPAELQARVVPACLGSFPQWIPTAFHLSPITELTILLSHDVSSTHRNSQTRGGWG